jgi:RNA polymerase sigma-70 factor, ECF subfamily
MTDVIANFYDRSVARFGDLAVSRSAYALRVMQACRLEDHATLHGEDLYLATACARGSEAAWVLLEKQYHAQVREACRYYVRPFSDAEDLTEIVWTSLFLPGRGDQPRISSYDGLCSLSTWLRTIVIRRAINYRREKAHAAKQPHLMVDLPDPRPSQAATNCYQKFEPILRDALKYVCDGLDCEDCQLLLWRFGEDMPLGAIARRLGVHQSTITRRIERLCEWIKNAARGVLAARHRMSNAQIDECFCLAGSGQYLGPDMMAMIRERRRSLEESRIVTGPIRRPGITAKNPAGHYR